MTVSPSSLPARQAAPNSAPPEHAATPDPRRRTGQGHLSHLTDIEKAGYFAAVAEALALLNAEDA